MKANESYSRATNEEAILLTTFLMELLFCWNLRNFTGFEALRNQWNRWNPVGFGMHSMDAISIADADAIAMAML